MTRDFRSFFRWPDSHAGGEFDLVAVRSTQEPVTHAIMTTDTLAKQAAVQFEWDGVTYTVGGVAKGSGMIHVNATGAAHPNRWC